MKDFSDIFARYLVSIGAAMAALLPLPLMLWESPCLADELTFRSSVAWLNAYTHSDLVDISANPANRILKSPEDQLISEVRPNLKWLNSTYEFVLRPRANVEWQRTYLDQAPPSLANLMGLSPEEQSSSKQYKTAYNAKFAEAFVTWNASAHVTLTLGLHSFQWGPAEVFSPSNQIFHETITSRTSLYDVLGHYLLRANISPSKTFNTVAMVEIYKNSDLAKLSDGEKFFPTLLIKSERSWHSGADYIGFVAGMRHKQVGSDLRPWIGQYLSVSIPKFDGFSFYGDASQQQGSDAWYPSTNQSLTTQHQWINFERTDSQASTIRNIYVLGVRYDFVDGEIFRIEYSHNDSAYSKGERQLALNSLTPQNPEGALAVNDNYKRYFLPGLDIAERELIYTSLNAPDFMSLRDLLASIRLSHSLKDKSSWTYFNLQYQIGDAGTLSASTTITAGQKDSELRGGASPIHTLAYRHDW